MRGCDEQCEAIQGIKEKMYRLNGTRKRQRNKCYKGKRKERKTVTAIVVVLIVIKVVLEDMSISFY